MRWHHLISALCHQITPFKQTPQGWHLSVVANNPNLAVNSLLHLAQSQVLARAVQSGKHVRFHLKVPSPRRRQKVLWGSTCCNKMTQWKRPRGLLYTGGRGRPGTSLVVLAGNRLKKKHHKKHWNMFTTRNTKKWTHGFHEHLMDLQHNLAYCDHIGLHEQRRELATQWDLLHLPLLLLQHISGQHVTATQKQHVQHKIPITYLH